LPPKGSEPMFFVQSAAELKKKLLSVLLHSGSVYAKTLPGSESRNRLRVELSPELFNQTKQCLQVKFAATSFFLKTEKIRSPQPD